MKFQIRFRYFFIFLMAFVLSSCGWIISDHRYDYLKERQSESVEVASDQATRPIVDYYPIPTTQENLVSSDSYEVPLPPQVFSSGSTNEIRMHRLGELRWLYVETLPSSVWPLMKDFWSSGDFGLSFEDPNTGVLESTNMPSGSSEGKLQMKIEHGIRQASSEIFLSHLMKDSNNNWVKVPVENRIGEEGKGWTYAKGLLQHERTGLAGLSRSLVALESLKENARSVVRGNGTLMDDPGYKAKIAELEIDLMASEYTELRCLASASAGAELGPESSILKLKGTEIQQRIQKLIVEASGIYSPAWGDQSVGLPFAKGGTAGYLSSRAYTIFGGASEVQRDVIAKNVLGLTKGSTK